MSKKLWGGRFAKKTDPLAEEFMRSIRYDYKLAAADVLGSLAHVAVLKKSGYLRAREAARLRAALNALFSNIMKGAFKPDASCEDIHTCIQNLLLKKAGSAALKLQTARSRNDQVVFAVKCYCKASLQGLRHAAGELQKALRALAQKNGRLLVPGFTHLQHAQPVFLKDYLMAYAGMIARDMERLSSAAGRIKLTMGSGALAGTPISASLYKINAGTLVKELKVAGLDLGIAPPRNSLDTTSDRDFVIEIISALSILAMHLSRLAEDLIIWSTREFDFVEIDEAYCTGSSLMPQKKNPDVLELVRGYAGRLYGNLVSVLTMMKGLPLTYNRDMQLDKEPLFDSFEIVSSELKILAGLVRTLKFNKDKIGEHLKDEGLYATDLVYYLVDRKVPFKEAHTIVGKLVKYSLDNSISIKDMPESLLQKFSKKLAKKEIVKLFDPLASVRSKKSVVR